MKNYTTQNSSTSTFIFIYSIIKNIEKIFSESYDFQFSTCVEWEREKMKSFREKMSEKFTSSREQKKPALLVFSTDIISSAPLKIKTKRKWMNNIIGHLSNLLATFNTSHRTHMLLWLLSSCQATHFYTTWEVRQCKEEDRRHKYIKISI